MDKKVVIKENASNIANKLLNKYPNLKIFLELLVKNMVVETKKVGEKFQYPSAIIKNNLYRNYGLFMDYFIRKILSNKFQTKLTDEVTELVLKDSDTYFKGNEQCRNLQSDIQKHYLIYKDSQKRAMDILESIKIVSVSVSLSFHDPLPEAEIETDNIALREVIKYFQGLRYSGVEMKAATDCKYFEGNADLIFDQEVLYEIKTSKYQSLARNDELIHVRHFYKLILYGFGYYKKTGKIIKCFKIYNPLLGYEYTLQLDDIDMKLFEKVLKKDVANNMKIK